MGSALEGMARRRTSDFRYQTADFKIVKAVVVVDAVVWRLRSGV
jgi:hypothetical protein